MNRIIQYLVVLIAVCLWPLVVEADDSETSAKNGDLGLRIFREGDSVRLSWTGRASLESSFSLDGGWTKQSQSSPVIFRVTLDGGTLDEQYFRLRPLLFGAIPGTTDVGNSPSAMATGDVNGDGRVDAVTANSGSNDLSILLNQRTSQLKQGKRLAVGDSPSSVVVADLNSDGAVDLVAANSDSSDISVLLNEGNGAFGSQDRFDVGDAPSSVAVADIDGDGMVDVVTSNRESGDASLLFGKGDGGFTAESRLDVRHQGGSGGRIDWRGKDVSSVALGDVNGDGAIDLVAGAILYREQIGGIEERGGGLVFLGDGDRSLTLPAPDIFSLEGAPLAPRSMVIADVNGDDSPEVLVNNRSIDRVSVHSTGRVQGDFVFQGGPNPKTGDSPTSLTVADLDHNGLMDIATANAGSDDVSVLLASNRKRFQPEHRFDGRAGPSAIAAIDVNDDGMLDLVAANERSDDVSVILNLAQ